MKKQIFLLLALIISTTAFAQGGFTNYKAVITDGGVPLANHAVTVRFTVLHSATQVFQESQTTTTDANGIIILNIGEANPTPWFAIQWKQLGFSLKTEYDTGSGFVDMGTQKFRFMPYAQHARTADIANFADEVDFSNITNVPAGLADGDDNTQLTDAQIAAMGYIKNADDADHSASNELQTISKNGSNLVTLSNGGGSFIDDDTQLTETQVDNYVANNGYATELNDLSDAKANANSIYIGNNSGLNDDNAANYNVGLGRESIQDNVNGKYNTAVGAFALKTNVGYKGNTAIGYSAMRNANNATSSDFSYNIAIGYLALKGSAIPSNNTGKYNTSIGSISLHDNTSGSNNTALGYHTLRLNTEGEKNVAIGNDAGHNNLIGSRNVFIGYKSGYYETGNDKLYIDNSNTTTPLIGGDFSTDKVTINGKLNVTNDIDISGSLIVADDAEVGQLQVINASSFHGAINIANGTQGDGKVLVSDAIGNASWSNTLPKQTKTINYAPSNFSVFSDTYGYRIGLTSAYIVSSSLSVMYLMLPINLPQGVKITNIKIYYKDNSTSNLEFGLKRKLANSTYYISTTLGTSSEEDSTLHTFEYVTPITLTNNYSYTIGIKSVDGAWGTIGSLAIYGVSITYEE